MYCCIIPVVLILSLTSGASAVTAQDAPSPRGGCPPVEEEIIDLEMLAQMLANTTAVGLFTKLSLKRDIDKVLARLENYHAGKGKFSLDQLEEQYNLLLMKIAAHLQDKDLILHRHLCNDWLLIWEDLLDYDWFHEHR
jgi:hypothetical protein